MCSIQSRYLFLNRFQDENDVGICATSIPEFQIWNKSHACYSAWIHNTCTLSWELRFPSDRGHFKHISNMCLIFHSQHFLIQFNHFVKFLQLVASIFHWPLEYLFVTELNYVKINCNMFDRITTTLRVNAKYMSKSEKMFKSFQCWWKKNVECRNKLEQTQHIDIHPKSVVAKWLFIYFFRSMMLVNRGIWGIRNLRKSDSVLLYVLCAISRHFASYSYYIAVSTTGHLVLLLIQFTKRFWHLVFSHFCRCFDKAISDSSRKIFSIIAEQIVKIIQFVVHQQQNI